MDTSEPVIRVVDILPFLRPRTIEDLLEDIFNSKKPWPKEELHQLFATLSVSIGETEVRNKFPEFEDKILLHNGEGKLICKDR